VEDRATDEDDEADMRDENPLCVPGWQSAKMPPMLAEMQRRFLWDDVRVFLALFRARTLSGAAVRLGVNASTAGRRLVALEEALGARLFDRTPDGVVPTAASEHLLAHAERLERAARSLGGAVDGLESRAAGVVRISAPPGVAEHFLAPALPRLLIRSPDSRRELDVSLRLVDLTRHEADLALRGLRPEGGDLVAVKIAEDDDGLFTSPGYAATLGTLRALGDARWIGWDRDLAHLPSARWLEEAVPDAKLVLRTNSVTAQLNAAEAGLGVVVLSEAYRKVRPLAAVRLSSNVRASLPALPRQSLWLVGHRATREVPRVAAVWETILETLGLLVRRRTAKPR
jgi:DNA-binding transcriptional LysR family regulator